MTVGTLMLHLNLPGCRSLKEKRSVLRRLVNQLRRDFNVSVAEVDKQDFHQTAILGVAIVTNDGPFANQVLSKLVDRMQRDPTCYLQTWSLEFR